MNLLIGLRVDRAALARGRKRGLRRARPTANRTCKGSGPTRPSRRWSGPPISPGKRSSRQAEAAAYEKRVVENANVDRRRSDIRSRRGAGL